MRELVWDELKSDLKVFFSFCCAWSYSETWGDLTGDFFCSCELYELWKIVLEVSKKPEYDKLKVLNSFRGYESAMDTWYHCANIKFDRVDVKLIFYALHNYVSINSRLVGASMFRCSIITSQYHHKYGNMLNVTQLRSATVHRIMFSIIILNAETEHKLQPHNTVKRLFILSEGE